MMLLSITSCGQVNMQGEEEGDSSAGQSGRDLVQETVLRGENALLGVMAAIEDTGTVSFSESDSNVLTITVLPGVTSVPVTVAVDAQTEVFFIANDVSFDSYNNTGSGSQNYTATFDLPVDSSNIYAVSQADDSSTFYTVNFVYDENAISSSLGNVGSDNVDGSSGVTSNALLTFDLRVQGERVASSSGVTTYDINIGALDNALTVNASAASGVEVDFLLNNKSVDTLQNNSQARKAKSVTFEPLNLRMMRMEIKMVATSQSSGDVETTRLRIKRDLGMSLINTAEEMFAVPFDTNEYSVHNMEYDGDRVIIGQPYDNGDHNSTADAPNMNMFSSGSVRIYVRSSNGWELESFIKATEELVGTGNNIGWSVDISGDLAFIGVPGADSSVVGIHSANDIDELDLTPYNSSLNTGAVYVYKRNTSNEWEFYKFIKPPNGNFRNFGQSLSVAENEDGSLTLAVSAPNVRFGRSGNNVTPYVTSSSKSGRVAVYEIEESNNGYTISHRQNIPSPKGQVSDSGFSFEIAITEKHLAVSEPYRDFVHTDSNGVETTYEGVGEVFVLSRASDQHPYKSKKSLTSILRKEERQKTRSIGTSLAIEDGFVFVGAPNYTESDSLQKVGAVYVFHSGNGGGRWRHVTKILSENKNAFDSFGYGISSSNKRLVIGVPGDNGGRESTLGNYNNTSSGNGAVFVYGLNAKRQWKPYGYFTQQVPFAESHENFGRDVKAYGDAAAIYSGEGAFSF